MRHEVIQPFLERWPRGTDLLAHRELVTIKVKDIHPHLDTNETVGPIGYVPIKIGVQDLRVRAASLGLEIVEREAMQAVDKLFQVWTRGKDKVAMFSIYEIRGSLHVMNCSLDRLAVTFFGDERYFYRP